MTDDEKIVRDGQAARLAKKLKDTGGTAEEILLVAMHLPELIRARAEQKAHDEAAALTRARNNLDVALRRPGRIG